MGRFQIRHRPRFVLNARERECLMLQRREALTYEQIAARLGLSKGSIGRYIDTARDIEASARAIGRDAWREKSA